MQKKDEFNLTAGSPKATRLNKKAIILLVGIVVIVVAALIITSFDGANNQKANSSMKLKPTKVVTSANKTIVANLPSSYGDAATIDKMLKRNEKPKLIYQVPPELTNEISSLRAQQNVLLQRINNMNNSGSQAVQTYESPLDKEAMTSSIFFAGGAPKPQSQKSMLASNKAKATSANAKAAAQSGKADPYATQNMQSAKLDFLTSKPSKAIYNKNTIQYPASRYILQAGSMIPAILQTKIVSNLPGFITAIVSQNVYDSITGQYLLVPKGSKLIGEYSSSISYGQDELQVKFTRLIRPDGTSIVLPNQPGVNALGTSGFKDDVDNHWGRVLGSAALMTVFNIPAIVATNQLNGSQNCNSDGSGCTYSMGSLAKASALQSIGQSVGQVGNKIASRSLNIQPTVIINAGYQFSVMVTKDMVLPPYKMPFNQHIPETM